MTRAAGIAAALVLAGCRRGPPVTADECDRLLARYAEALLHRDGERPTRDDVEATVRAARARAATHPAFAACPRTVSRESMDCALHAGGVDAIERCLVPVP